MHVLKEYKELKFVKFGYACLSSYLGNDVLKRVTRIIVSSTPLLDKIPFFLHCISVQDPNHLIFAPFQILLIF
jgi:hypothetical protein